MGKAEWQQQAVAEEDLKWLVKNLEETPFFNHEALIEIIAPKFEIYAVTPETAIVTEGEKGDDIFLIYEGTVSVSKGASEVSQLGKGNYFGEMALLVNQDRRAATVRAVDQVRFFVLWGDDFKALIMANPELKSFLEAVAKERQQDS